MKNILIAAFWLSLFQAQGQTALKMSGKQFFAISVSNADSSSAWYERVFQLELLKEFKTPDGKVKIIGNDNLLVEIIETVRSVDKTACNVGRNEPYRIRGFFKIGFYVSDIKGAEQYLKKKNVIIKHGIFEDADAGIRSLIIEDNSGN